MPRRLSVLIVALALGVEARAADDGGFEALIREARSALAKKDLDRARSLCKDAVAKSGDPPEGGPNISLAHALRGDVELERKRHRAAVRAYRRALALSAGDEAVRRSLIAKRRRAATEGKLAKELERLEKIAKHEAFALQTEKQPGVSAAQRAEVRAKLAEAAGFYRSEKDPERARWAEAVRALVSVRSGAVEEGYAEAEKIAAEKTRVARTREVALDAMWKAATALNRPEAAVRAALGLNALRAQRMPEPKRRWARMRGLDALCERYDAETRAGACARLEREVTGTFTFTDLSGGKPLRELGDRELDRVHAQLLPAIEDCVLGAARASPERYDNADVEVGWAIQPNGSISDLSITPKRYREELEPCVKERLGWARYPKYTSGERKTVAIPFHLGR